MIEIKGATVEVDFKYKPTEEYHGDDKEYFIRLKFPIPGGHVQYELPIEKSQHDSIEFCNKLVNNASNYR